MSQETGEEPTMVCYRAFVDFSRDVYCILGLPFDAIGLVASAERIRLAAVRSERLFVSTPNLNFVIMARDDAAFRQSILRSQLSLADGMPIFWVSKLMGVPLPERVAGAGVFEHLLNMPQTVPLKVFFFGGPEGVAAAASDRVNARSKGVRCVGYETPSYLPVEALSGQEVTTRINDSAPDFVVVALGARKGQAWIERNGPYLEAPVISHLGAVVNFAAGTVNRAPVLLQRLGMEWLWRIKEEPTLWRRYAHDGLHFLRLVFGTVLPLSWERMASKIWYTRESPIEHEQMSVGHYEIAIPEVCGGVNIMQLRGACQRAADARTRVIVDVTRTRYIDAAAMGCLLILKGYQTEIGRSLDIVGAGTRLRRLFRLHGASYLLDASESGTCAFTADDHPIGTAAVARKS